MRIADGKSYIKEVRQLILEYTGRLGRDLAFQNLDEELADPARKYTAPEGEILVAQDGEKSAGMIAYHRHSWTRCEMKRLYVRPAYRGMHLGEQLIEQILIRAKEAGYQEMVLDTLAPMQAVIHLYEKFGFRECETYYENPMENVIYMRKELS